MPLFEIVAADSVFIVLINLIAGVGLKFNFDFGPRADIAADITF